MIKEKPLDIHDYLKRINYQGPLEPTLQTLQALHENQLLAVPFENLSIHYGQPIILQEEALFNKIVDRRRGGFCYELNGLFAWLLRQLGFRVTLLSAEVFNDQDGFSPEFDHLTLLVHQLSGDDWLADVGFGDSFRQPLRFTAALEQDGADEHTYRLQQNAEEGDAGKQRDYWILQQRNAAGWEPQYRFTLQPHALTDFAARCYYHQTSPESHFTQKRLCSLATTTGRISLSELRLITTTHGKRQDSLLADQEAYARTLAEQFGIVL